MRVVWLALLLVAAPGLARAQAWLDQPGALGATVVAIGSARPRLPPGDWISAGEISSTIRDEGIPLPERIFMQTADNRVVAVVYLNSNGSPATSRKGFLPGDKCFRQDVFLNDSQNVYPGQFNCLIVTHVMWQGQPPPAFQVMAAKAAALGGLPHPMIAADFSIASPDRLGLITVQVYFNPASAGFTSKPDVPWAQSEWNKANATPDRIAYLNKVAAWARAYRPTVAAAWN